MDTLSEAATVMVLLAGWLRLSAAELTPAGSTSTRIVMGWLTSTEGLGVPFAPLVVSRSQAVEAEVLNCQFRKSHLLPTSGLLVVTTARFGLMFPPAEPSRLPLVVPEKL